MEPRTLCETALAAARCAAAVHRRHLGTLEVSEWAEKGTADFVTRVDREAEEAVIELVSGRFPRHRFLAEESTELGDPASVRARFDEPGCLWVVDPLDGTTNYLHGYPAYAASVAAVREGAVVAGAVVDSTRGTEWTAWLGGGAWQDGEPVRVSAGERLEHALIGTGFPFKALELMPTYLRQFDAILRRTSGIRRAGAAALDLCHVASGWLDGFWELWLAPWDVAAGTLIVREAGGIVTTITGDDDVRGAGPLVAANPRIHPRLLEILDEHPLPGADAG